MSEPRHLMTLELIRDDRPEFGGYVVCDERVRIGDGETPQEAFNEYIRMYGDDLGIEVGE